nr:vascular endothelial growth factor receptor 1-like [Megalopta genalis]
MCIYIQNRSKKQREDSQEKMVCRQQRFLLAVALLSHLYRDSTALKPNLSSTTDQIIKKEGDRLWLQCSGESEIVFMYPINSTEFPHTSAIEINKNRDKNGTYTYEFVRPNAVYGDTGWYGCSDHFIETSARNYSDPEVNWVYVFVESETVRFVEQTYYKSLIAVVGENIVIPCRPTSPTAEVHLTKQDEDLDINDAPSFDPKFGFTLYDVKPHDQGLYACSIAPNEEVLYHIYVTKKYNLTEPTIINDTLRHVTKGETLYVNCTTNIPKDVVDYTFNWSTPQQSNRISTRDYTGSNGKITTELTIKNVTYEDEGIYQCIIKSFYTEKKSQTYIKVLESIEPYISLTTQDPNRHYQHHMGDQVKWVVYVDAYPPAKLKWLNTNGDEITSSSTSEESKFSIDVTCCKPILRINRLEFHDMGVYSIQASNQYKMDTLNFTLDVIAEPVLYIRNLNSYYLPNQVANVECHVAAFPKPNITWSYRNCPKFPVCENGVHEYLTHTTESGTVTSLVSTVSTTIEMSGELICSACNIVGCGNVSENVLVSDGAGEFGIVPPMDPVVEGDDLELICAASIYNYTDSIYWSSETGPIVESDRISIQREKTQFTYRSILRIQNVEMEDSQEYICMGKSTGNLVQSHEYHLAVTAARPPVISNTNFKKDTIVIDLNTPGNKKVCLKCFADGMPNPNITWFKDGTQLVENNERYKFFNTYQQFEIQYPIEIDSGEYMCRAQNRIAKVEAQQRVVVKGKGVPVGLIILVIMLAVVVVVLVIYFTIKVRRERMMRKELMEAGLMHFEEGAVECLNPDLTVDDQAELLPYDNKWEFPREKLKLGRQLGSGAFGVVLKAEAQGICENEPVTTVAVKMVRRATNLTYVRALTSELKILVHLGKHLNVVNLLGACTKNILKRELLVIVEYCRFGNLHNYLLRHRGDFINQIDSATGKFDPSIGLDLLTRTASVCSTNRIKYAELSFSRSISRNLGTDSVQYHAAATDSQGISMSPDGTVLSNGSTQPGWCNYRGDYKDYNLKPICTQDLLSWAFQVARGMEYLSQRKVLHGDLAARNILLAENNVVKICDFGLAKTMYKEENYKKKGDGPLPIKWLAIESIRDRIFSTQSDIWSFGIVLWEFFTLAETPYPGMEAEIQYQKLIEGYRMEQPEYATPEVYEIMRQCWKAKPTLRPSFTELVDSIGNLLEDSVRAHYIQLNDPYLDMNTILLESGKDDYLTMLSAPDHAMLSSPTHEYVNSPISGSTVDSAYLCMSPRSQTSESGIFSPRPHQERTHFDFPSPTSDCEDAVEMSPMLKKQEDDPYLKPIDVHERRAEFARNRQMMKNQVGVHHPARDSGYCNAPKNLELIDLNKKNDEIAKKSEMNSNPTAKMGFAPPIIRTQDNYVNMPRQKCDMKKDLPDGFSNPSYVIIGN